jgi:outer membrane murein-binding lipoprotein Lpp
MMLRCLAVLCVCLLAGCQVRRYNNCVVNEIHDSQQIRASVGQAENLSEGTDQQKRLNDVGNPDLSIPVTP